MKIYRGLAAFAATLISCTLLCLYGGAALAEQPIAVADGTPEIDNQIASGQLNTALQTLDQHIADHSADVQAKFKRATVLARLNRDADAITAFTALIQQYPELPEPYNNLAALYAKRGDLAQARAMLETAVAANPAYALASQNLGTLYLRLALQSYQRATTIAPSDTLSAQRIAAINNVLHLPPPAAAATATSAASTTATDQTPAAINNNLLTPSPQAPNFMPNFRQ